MTEGTLSDKQQHSDRDGFHCQLAVKDVPLIFLIGILSFVVHEFAHWLAGSLMGYDMFVSINKAGLSSGEYSQEWHRQLVSAAGPLVTILIALAALWLISKFRSHKFVYLFPVVFISAMMRAMATLVSVANPNDEARISQWLGLGKWTLPFLVSFFLAWVAFLAAEKLKLNWKSWAICFVAASLAITVIVFTEPFWPVINPRK